MGTEKLKKGLDEQLLEGGGAGGGRQSATAKKVQSMTPQERTALLENVGKQFETISPIEQRAMAKIRKANESKDPTEFANPGEQFRKKKGGVVSASKRADGVAARGKTRGRMV